MRALEMHVNSMSLDQRAMVNQALLFLCWHVPDDVFAACQPGRVRRSVRRAREQEGSLPQDGSGGPAAVGLRRAAAHERSGQDGGAPANERTGTWPAGDAVHRAAAWLHEQRPGSERRGEGARDTADREPQPRWNRHPWKPRRLHGQARLARSSAWAAQLRPTKARAPVHSREVWNEQPQPQIRRVPPSL